MEGPEPDLLCYYLRTLPRSSSSVNLQLQCDRCFGDGVGPSRREWLSRGRPLGGLKKAHNAGPGLPKRRGGWGGGTQARKKVPLKFNYIYWRSIVRKTGCWIHWSHSLLISTQWGWCYILLSHAWILSSLDVFPKLTKEVGFKPSLTSKLIIFLAASSVDHALESALGSGGSLSVELPGGNHGRWVRQAACGWVLMASVTSSVHSNLMVPLDLREITASGSLDQEGSTLGSCILGLGLSTSHLKAVVMAVVRGSDMGHLPLGIFLPNCCHFSRASVPLLFLLRLLISNKPPRSPKAIWFVS